ncbi:TetR/AcrR family transcriptional regulator [Paraburkholderia lycopersici]|uniref:DNA-binding transcriptional regulator, AcrR family n=1 Tax=Paraburkholderia lycopersici TaxID=416944 RepID=A0A1G7AYX6_9BURK|nr:TetR/AcrR family transcriptional regulator [Paraburkholderia lycopersici]SDE19912.1 DNA-binding transcriptional regulator, AcrR family [Paraburkholderia lycopersici]
MATRSRPSSSTPRQRGRRRADADLDMRERLLASATQLFGEQGIAATTMAQIAEAAGVTSAMVHYYFTNREKLLDAVVEERIARSIAFVWESVESDVAQDAHALVEELIARLFDVTSRMPWLPPLWLREIVNEGGLLRERMLKRLPVEQLQRFAARVGEAQRNGAVNAELEAPLLFISILALVMLPLATSKLWQSTRGFPKIEREALQRHVSALLRAALRPAPQEKRAASSKGDAS